MQLNVGDRIKFRSSRPDDTEKSERAGRIDEIEGECILVTVRGFKEPWSILKSEVLTNSLPTVKPNSRGHILYTHFQDVAGTYYDVPGKRRADEFYKTFTSKCGAGSLNYVGCGLLFSSTRVACAKMASQMMGLGDWRYSHPRSAK